VNWRTIDDLRLQQILPGCADEDVRVAAQDFVAGCLQGDPAKRLTMQQLLGHPFIQMHRAQLLEPEVEPEVEPEPEAEAEVEPEVEWELELEVKPEVELEVERELEPEVEPEPEREINSNEGAITILAEAVAFELDLLGGPEPAPETAALPGLQQLSLLAATWHFFLSHMQTEARDLVKDLFSMMEESGCRAWLDMQAEQINRPHPAGVVPRPLPFA
jgi:hypothetical protein